MRTSRSYRKWQGLLLWRPCFRRSISGFSLPELLVVCVIVAILAGLTFFSIARAKSLGRSTQCLSNLRQQGQLLSAFVLQYNVYPLTTALQGAVPSGGPPFRSSWASTISDGDPKGFLFNGPGDSKTGIFQCPSITRYIPDYGTAFASYGYNAFGLVGADGAGGLGLGGIAQTNSPALRPIRDTEVLKTSEMMAIGDGVVGSSAFLNDGLITLTRTAQPSHLADQSARVRARHRSQLSILFCDGHCEGVTLSGLFAQVDGGLSKWNRDAQPHYERAR